MRFCVRDNSGFRVTDLHFISCVRFGEVLEMEVVTCIGRFLTVGSDQPEPVAASAGYKW